MIKKIELSNFRLFDNICLDTNNSLVIFSGKNATGKTSILEAINIASTTKSHRERNLINVIKDNKDYLSIKIKANKEYKVIIDNENKNYFINNKKENIIDYVGNLDVILFSPDDLNLINGSKIDRRRFLDLELSLINKDYLRNLIKYKKILNERNELLKNKNIDLIYLDVLTNSLIDSLKLLYYSRIALIDDINNYLIDISKLLNVGEIKLEYVKTYDPNDILNSFNLKKEKDILTHFTNIGIHRDDFKIYLDKKDVFTYASSGQKRIIVIAIKLALIEYYKRIKNKDIILLLDDVFAELDKERITNLVKYIKRLKQVFITTTTILEVPDEILKEALVLRI